MKKNKNTRGGGRRLCWQHQKCLLSFVFRLHLPFRLYVDRRKRESKYIIYRRSSFSAAAGERKKEQQKKPIFFVFFFSDLFPPTLSFFLPWPTSLFSCVFPWVFQGYLTIFSSLAPFLPSPPPVAAFFVLFFFLLFPLSFCSSRLQFGMKRSLLFVPRCV